MQFPNSDRQDLTCQGQELNIGCPFEEGHELTAHEAGAMNQLFKENIRNNFAPRIKAMSEGGESLDAMQKAADEYCGEYEFGLTRSGGSRDAKKTAAMGIARKLVRSALLKKGYKSKDIEAPRVTELAEAALGKNENDWIWEQAEAQVALQKDSTGDIAVDL